MDKTKNFLSTLYHSTPLRLILLAFIIYNANLRSITSFDTNPTRYLPIAIIKNFSLNLNEFTFIHKYPAWWIQTIPEESRERRIKESPNYLTFVRGNYMSAYPVMTAILSVPVYIIPVILGLTEGDMKVREFNQTEVVGTMLSKISASLAVAISGGIMYLTLLQLTSRRKALWLSLIYAFATSSWSVSSQGLWQSAMSQPTLALAFYFFIKARENERNVIYASIPLALSVACRPSNIIFALILLIYVIHKHHSQLMYFIIFPAILSSLLLTYNIYYFNNPIGGYISLIKKWDTTIAYKEEPIIETEKPTIGFDDTITAIKVFSHAELNKLLGLLFSPSRGLLAYSPFLIFSFIAMGIVFYRRKEILLIYISIATILTIIFFASWPGGWFGGFNYSYRLLVDLVPGLILLLALIFNWILSNKILKHLFIIMVAFSVFIQIIGTFFYPCSWYLKPVPAVSHLERFWDWKDPEFLRCLNDGPVEPEGLSLLKVLITKLNI